MAEIKAFKGMRYTKAAGKLGSLVCPPYDIISEGERERYIKENPYNIIRLELPKGGEERYKEAGDTLKDWLNKGILARDSEDSIYVYEMVFSANGLRHRLKGFVTLVKLTDFSEGIVLPHEETLSKAKEDRFNLMSETFSNFSQIYSLYMDGDGAVYSLVDGCSKGMPDMEVKDPDGTVHKMWKVSDGEVVKKIVNLFEDKKLYIADGHHRYETALNFHKKQGTAESGYAAMMLVNMENDGLVVFPTHRIVKNLENFNAEKVIEDCKPYFDIAEAPGEERMQAALNTFYDEGKKAFAMYTGYGKCYVMTLKDETAVKKLLPEKSEAYCGLDVTALHSLVLEKILGIDRENMANQKNLAYTRSREEALTAVDMEEADCSFILNPTKVSEIRDVAAAGEKMPQKSTYFYPKLITGLVMNKFSD
ncbi:MAG: DUF1015 domain-containing protein [Ruminococcus sp.]|nr:DUF1015 domain-containing protein [Ruminococcus sp.]MCM1382902.1 DUF1015 domain-containing protein [Muribaculaceae bacterium]MCM1480231.1 DUF1015 domain-containing protein [Muribaculaceae bacterium]